MSSYFFKFICADILTVSGILNNLMGTKKHLLFVVKLNEYMQYVRKKA